MSVATSPVVDVNVPRFNQAVIAVVTACAFVFQMPVLVWFGFGLLFVSRVFGPDVAPLTQFYVRLVRPRRTDDIEFEAAAPPAFAQLLGTVTLGAAAASLAIGWTVVGWGLTLLVTALASLAAVARICVGCVLYRRFAS